MRILFVDGDERLPNLARLGPGESSHDLDCVHAGEFGLTFTADRRYDAPPEPRRA